MVQENEVWYRGRVECVKRGLVREKVALKTTEGRWTEGGFRSDETKKSTRSSSQSLLPVRLKSYTTWYHMALCCTTSYHIILHHVTSHHIVFHYIMSHHTLSIDTIYQPTAAVAVRYLRIIRFNAHTSLSLTSSAGRSNTHTHASHMPPCNGPWRGKPSLCIVRLSVCRVWCDMMRCNVIWYDVTWHDVMSVHSEGQEREGWDVKLEWEYSRWRQC